MKTLLLICEILALFCWGCTRRPPASVPVQPPKESPFVPLAPEPEPPTLTEAEPFFVGSVYFEFDDYTLTPKAKRDLEQISFSMDGKTCWFEGNTCPIGSHDYNMTLSVKRAEAVRTRSMRWDSVIYGLSEDNPVTKDPDQYHLNRRVDVFCQEKKQ
jgi:outer membrane protein OmpA-like peptidoglycan-associated protein